MIGIKHIHSKNIVHGDIKLSNIMIKKSGQIKVIDFGYSTILTSDDQLITNYSGTPVYLAPEIVANKPFDGIF